MLTIYHLWNSQWTSWSESENILFPNQNIWFDLQYSSWQVQFLLVAVLFLGAECHLSEEEMKNYLATTYEKEMTSACYKINDATFAFNTDIKNKLKEQIVVGIQISTILLNV